MPIAPNVDSGKSAAPKSSGKTPVSGGLKTSFADTEHWDELAETHLSHYTLPPWSKLVTADELRAWIERMDLPQRAYLKMGAYRNLQDAIDLNSTWPLRALIGLALELRDETQ